MGTSVLDLGLGCDVGNGIRGTVCHQKEWFENAEYSEDGAPVFIYYYRKWKNHQAITPTQYLSNAAASAALTAGAPVTTNKNTEAYSKPVLRC